MKRIIKTFVLALLVAISFSLLSIGPLYNIKVNEHHEVLPIEEVESLSFTEGEHTFGNKKIEATSENADAVFVQNGGTVITIESGYYDGGDLGSTTAVYARDGAKVIINNGIFKAGEGCAAIYAKNNSIVEINGGHFEVDGPYGETYFVLNLADNTNSQILVKGGTFVNFNPADNKSENPQVNFVAEGYEVTSETKENGDVWYTVVPMAGTVIPESSHSDLGVEGIDYATKEVVLGDSVLGFLKIEVENKYYLQTISTWVSGFIFGFVLCYIIKSIKRKQKKNKKNQSKKNGSDNSLKVNFPNPVEQNQHKKNNITF